MSEITTAWCTVGVGGMSAVVVGVDMCSACGAGCTVGVDGVGGVMVVVWVECEMCCAGAMVCDVCVCLWSAFVMVIVASSVY